MTLDRWLRETGTKEEALAETIGVAQGTINRYRRGYRAPRPEIARKIVAATEGAVTFEELYAERAA